MGALAFAGSGCAIEPMTGATALKEIAHFLMGSHHVGGGSEMRSMNDEI